MSNFTGKIAVVTGAAKGIGAGAVKRYLDDGIEKVALVDMNLEAAQATAKELDPPGPVPLPSSAMLLSLRMYSAALMRSAQPSAASIFWSTVPVSSVTVPLSIFP
ncbi:MAG: SDR family NAD(P)-dependent oxidoreductase [Ruminococcaceae bacterium]|nr:SDR family NAD(P)-dependent oxidoreductase [Oscillospiraceae bacterium]